MDHIEGAAGKGLERLFDYGAAMIVLVLLALAMAWVIRYLLNRCDERFDQSLTRHETTAKQVTEVLDRNTTTYAQAVVLLADVKDALRDLKK
jgi:hypothetical protein